jgi:3-hydroxyisobutyrate dehydrogenase/2-hydroxy-3-oxopropionate reductase
MANQIAIAGAVTGVAEAVRYGQAAGLDLTKMLGTISTGAAGSWQMSNNGPKMVSGDYAPGFFIKHYVKDLRIAQEEGKERELKLPILKKVLKMYAAMEEEGQGDLGTQAIIEKYQE